MKRIVWRVSLAEIASGTQFGQKDIIAPNIAEACEKAEKLATPVNDGKGHVYDVQAVAVKFISSIDG